MEIFVKISLITVAAIKDVMSVKTMGCNIDQLIIK